MGMIISASRRTDIPAFYAQWFMNRIKAGYCEVPNPFNPSQIASVSLRPEDVDVIVFWTRNPLPMLPHLMELNARGYRYHFLFTGMNNPRVMDPHGLPIEIALDAFRVLADCIGPEKVTWRYDPIVLTHHTDPDFHKRTFSHIAKELVGYTHRCIISTVNLYRKATSRLAREEIKITHCGESDFGDLMRFMGSEAHDRGMDIFSCAQPLNLDEYGIEHGKCVDDAYIRKVFGIEVTKKKDPSQRKACGCVISKDVGMYDTCVFGCLYCYATSSFEKARANFRKHNPDGSSLVS